MKPASQAPATVKLALAVVLAFAVHAAFGGHMLIGDARPNLSLTALLTGCLFLTTETGTWLGFSVGLLEASFSARYIGSYIVTRTLSGCFVGMLEDRVFRESVPVAMATAFLGTLAVETCFFAFAPQPDALRTFAGFLLEAAYNSVLAIPVYLLFRRLAPRRPH